MPHKKDKPTYRSKKDAVRHGYITYKKTSSGARKFRVDKTKSGWNVSRK